MSISNEIPYIVLQAYGFGGDTLQVLPFGTGLINHTWKVTHDGKDYILQRINDQVFTRPMDIAENIKNIAAYLQTHSPGYYFVTPVSAAGGRQMVYREGPQGGYFRLLPFVPGSHSKDVVHTAGEAREAAAQFGRFTKLLSGFDASQLKISLPFFHDLSYRYQAFKEALQKGNPRRIAESEALIRFIQQHEAIVTNYELIRQSDGFIRRVTHHDTKISNVLFDAAGRGLCVIDLDTVMPGYFISDVGDMMRTYLSPVSEEETDFDKIAVREDIYKAIVAGYSGEMAEALTEKEKAAFFYAGKFMIYMQAIRFLTDYINNDSYYGAKYPGHNLARAHNQIVLLQKLMEKEALLS